MNISPFRYLYKSIDIYTRVTLPDVSRNLVFDYLEHQHERGIILIILCNMTLQCIGREFTTQLKFRLTMHHPALSQLACRHPQVAGHSAAIAATDSAILIF